MTNYVSKQDPPVITSVGTPLADTMSKPTTRRKVFQMGAAIAAVVTATAASEPTNAMAAMLKSAVSAWDSVGSSHPDAAILALCKEWEAKNDKYEEVCKRESKIQNELSKKLPEELARKDPIEIGRGRVARPIRRDGGWTQEELRSISQGKYTFYGKKSRRPNGDIVFIHGDRPVIKKAARMAAGMLATLKENQKQRDAIWAQIKRSENRQVRPLNAADRVASKIGAMPARTLDGIRAKIHVFRASSMLEATWPDDPFTLPILQDIERLGSIGKPG